jgi:phosphoribosyl-AMP cyclohydrolase
MTTSADQTEIRELPIDFGPSGLVPVVAQDADTGAVLMVAFMNEAALQKTFETGFVHYWSRSRNALWQKGATSGNVQRLEDIYVNCDQNSLLLTVRQTGAVCHDGYPTCYYRRFQSDGTLETTTDRWFDPAEVYGSHASGGGHISTWFGAYEYLSDHDLTDRSGTSRLLRSESIAVSSRVADELLELAGVIDGTHRHGTLANDLILEGSQVLYWLVVTAVHRRYPAGRLALDRALVPPETPAKAKTARKLLQAEAERWRMPDFVPSPESIHQAVTLVAQAVASCDIDPKQLIQHDLAELRSKAYLDPYFNQLSEAG